MKNFINLFFRVRSLFNTLYQGYRAKLLSLSVLGIISGFMEGIGVALLVSLFASLIGSGASGTNVVADLFGKLSAASGIHFGFQTLLGIAGLLFFFKAMLLYAYGKIRTRIVGDYKVAIRRRLYKEFLGASFSFLRKQKLGHIDYVILADVEASAKMLENVIMTILSVSLLCTYALIAFMLSPVVATVGLVIGGGLLFLFRPFDAKLRNYARTLISTAKSVAHSINETIIGMKSVKAFGVERAVLEDITELFRANEQAEIHKQDIKNLIKVSIEPITIAYIFVAFATSYKFFTFDVSTFVPIIYLIQQIFLRISKIQDSKNLLSSAFPHAESVEKMLADIRAEKEAPAGTKPFAFTDSLRFSNVSFSYENEQVIHDVSFAIRRGEMVGVVGPSGGGKTTLADLLLRFITPSHGSILIDGVPIADITANEWRAKMIYVAQDAFLRHDTILENIRFFDRSLSDGRIAEATKMANIHNFIITLPDGLLTIVGERGTRLSGGERQRIALARALAREPAVLVLDEATSALDNESEAMIKEALHRLRGKITIVLIAHRLSTVINADRIIVLDSGKIIESGAPNELLRDPQSYFSRSYRLGSIEAM